MKRLLTLAIAAIALASAAMPTKEEIRKAVPLVGELMNPLVAEYKAKKKTAVEVGDSAMVYAKEAETEAAKFLLLKGAIWYFAQAKDDAKAVKATSLLREQVKNIPPKMLINDVLKPAIDRIGEQDVPGLFVQYRAASARAMIASGDISRQQRAELLAVAEGWKEALAAFAKLGDTPPAKAARAEKEGKNLAAAADFWWSYAPEEESAKDAIKAHAAALYRKAIASGELTGLKKAIAEKRIATLPDSDSFAASTAKAEHAPAATGTTGVSPVAAPAPTGTTGVSPVAAGAATSSRGNSRYCVIDLSAGPSASRYPVQWLAVPPAGGFNTDEYKTSKLVLRRIEPGSFRMCGKFDVTLTKPFYIGVFEMTQRQYELVMGWRSGNFKNPTCYATRPVGSPYDKIRGSSLGAGWPASSAVDADSFMGRMRARTGIDFDLPTEAQWEYACRANTKTQFNNGTWPVKDQKKDPNLDKLGRYLHNGGYVDGKVEPDKSTCTTEYGTAAVGSYLPNAWGLYDMHGNACELCLDWFGDLSSGGIDPKGPPSGEKRVWRGGGWCHPKWLCTSEFRDGFKVTWGNGFRLALTVNDAVTSGAPAASSAAVASAPSATPQISLSANGRPKNKILQLGNGEKIDMIGCPAGTFQMSNVPEKDKPSSYHKVTITRPFWISKTVLTARQLKGSLSDDMQTTVDKVVREFPDNEVVVSLKPRETDSLCAALNRQLASSLPPGYVCRPPTEAELEYAWLANGTEMNVEKARIGVDTMIAFAEKGWVPKDLHWYRYYGEYQGIFLLPRQLPLNAWGLGMTSGVRYRTIDRIASEKGKLEEFVMPNEIVYADEEIDPVRQTNASVASYISRVGTRRQRSLVLKIPIHLVIGPDLLKEREQKK